MAIQIIVLFFQFAILNRQCNCAKIEGYYWRDYGGITPKDALVAGRHYNGDPIFVGQAGNGSVTMSGKIYLNSPYLYYESHGVKCKREFIKILCTPTPKDFVWVRSGVNEKYPSNLVIGGFEWSEEAYIGRVFYGLETVVGKVIAHRMWAVHNNNTAKRFDKFEILTYRP